EQAKRLDDIYAAITGLRSEENGRYQVASGRFAWTSGVLRTLAAQNGAVVDEQAIASSIAAELAPSLAASLAESVQRLAPAASVEDVRKAAADAVRDVLGALDNPAS
ncbi:MAG: hypothetical protein HOU01_23695, partial [Streptomycetaceae bacterium]|nr:hypothetical protein [Streptomycetaceae bacterium]